MAHVGAAQRRGARRGALGREGATRAAVALKNKASVVVSSHVANFTVRRASPPFCIATVLNPLAAAHSSQAGTLVLYGRAQNPFRGKQNDPNSGAFVVADAPMTRTPPTRSAKLPWEAHPPLACVGGGSGPGGEGGGGDGSGGAEEDVITSSCRASTTRNSAMPEQGHTMSADRTINLHAQSVYNSSRPKHTERKQAKRGDASVVARDALCFGPHQQKSWAFEGARPNGRRLATAARTFLTQSVEKVWKKEASVSKQTGASKRESGF